MDMKKWNLANRRGSIWASQMLSNDDVPGFLTFFDFTRSTYFTMEGQTSNTLSTAGKFSNHLCPQKGKGNVEIAVAEVKSSLLAGVQWKRK